MGDVIDSTHMHINKGNEHGRQRERTNGVKFQHSRLLKSQIVFRTDIFLKLTMGAHTVGV